MKKLLPLLILSALTMQACASDSGIEDEDPLVGDTFYFPMPDETPDVVESRDQRFHVQTVAEGFSVPWAMAFLPDGEVLVTERSGEIYVIENGERRSEPIEGTPEVYASGQGGMLDILLHPDYDENGWIYVTYSRTLPQGGANTALARFRLEDNRAIDFQELFTGTPGYHTGQHFGSRIAFDDDGYVYFSIGDRGVMESSQELDSHTAVVIRLHDDGSVPSDNPFVDEPGALPEIYAYGLRNIQGMAIHPETREIWSHKHGPRGGDEINIIGAGLNYGWPEITHGTNYDGSIITPDTARDGMEQPLLHWTPSIAPSGMAFVTGNRYPGWQGDIMVGTLAPRYLHRVVLDGEEVIEQEELLDGIGRVRDVRLAPDGYLYIAVEHPGVIHRLLPANN
ncbi:PQQ-dependent sugar dehydrogenase [Balneolales bacterium ANBcel1]|nr:PQQ-dependent sugar dehydrogenase [Balneolales bacterium ANBcel1]